MESVRLSSNPVRSLAGIDEIINRGDREAFVGLLHAIIEQPGGPVADRVRVLYERVQHRAADPEFAAWPQYQAAYWLTEAMGQFRPVDMKSQRFASVWDAIEDNPAEAEKMKQWSALRMKADEMAALLCVQPVLRAATADEVLQWIDWWQPSYEAAQRLSNNEIAACKANRKWPPVTDRMIAEMSPPIRGAMSTARDIERAMLDRCLQIATTPGDMPRDQAEANVCRLAGMIVDGRYPEAGKRLSDAATAYFADHPEQQVASAEVVRRGWVINAPRLRDRLERMLEIAAVPVYEHEDQA